MARSQRLTKRVVDAAEPAIGADGRPRETVLWDGDDGGVKGFGLRVSANGARSFILMYRAGKGRAAPLRKVTIGTFGSPWTVDTARAQAKRLLGEVAADRDPAAAQAAKRAAKHAVVADQDAVRAAVEEWLRRDQAENRTAAEVRATMAKYVIPAWGDRPLESVRKRDVIELIDRVAETAPVRANRVLAYLKRFLSWCAARDMIEASPAATVEKVARETARDRVLDDAELVAVWRAAEAMGGVFGMALRVLILTAARRAEVFEARRGEVVENGTALRLPAERSKNGEGRIIWLAEPAQRIVAALPDYGADSFLFSYTGRSPYTAWSGAKERLDDAAARIAGTPLAPWRLHDLRRSVATGMQRLGVRLEAIEAVLGHVSGSRAGIVGIYQRHRFEDEAREAVELWGDHVGRLLDPTPAKVVPMRRDRHANA